MANNMINTCKPLSGEEQLILYNKIKRGNKDAKDQIIYSCLPLVISIAKKFRYNNRHIDLDDMIQEGNIALMHAVDNWDIHKGVISTVATWYIKNALINMVTDADYNIKYAYTMSRRAAEQLRKIKNLDSHDIEYIANETGFSEKRVHQLLSIAPKGSFRLNIQEKTIENLENNEEIESKPCIGDLIDLVNNNLSEEEKTIFCLWAGIDRKKIGKKQIAKSLDKTEKYVYDIIKSSIRILSRAAKVLQDA